MLLFSCKKDKEIKSIPIIQFVSISPNQIEQFKENVIITVSYEDVEGDLGHVNADSLTVYVKDSRLSNPDYFHIPPLTPNTNLNIKGNLEIEITGPFLLGNGTTETVNYKIKIKDREGNWSNEIKTDNITINE